MSIEAALDNTVFLTYLAIVGGILVFAGAVLGVLTLLGRDVSSIWKTYRGWLLMIPLVFGTILLGRVATIIGVTLLAPTAPGCAPAHSLPMPDRLLRRDGVYWS